MSIDRGSSTDPHSRNRGWRRRVTDSPEVRVQRRTRKLEQISEMVRTSTRTQIVGRECKQQYGSTSFSYPLCEGEQIGSFTASIQDSNSYIAR